MTTDDFRRLFLTRYTQALAGPRFPDNVDRRRGQKQAGGKGVGDAVDGLMFVEDHRDRIAALHAALGDERSRETLVFHYLNRILGNLATRAPHVDARFREIYEGVEGRRTQRERRLSPHQWLASPIYIEEYVLPVAGHAVTIETNDISAIEVFGLDQYVHPDPPIQVLPGDVVIDGGACWGDTALYFAAQGAAKVFAFELSQSNIEVMAGNLARNPAIGSAVEVVRAPLAHERGLPLYIVDRGAASRVSAEPNGGEMLIGTSLDAFVADRGLDRVDFIKLDVEGAERAVLAGANETIRRFRPNMALSVYHRADDPFVLFEQLRSLVPDYRFFLKGVSMNYGETVMFATAR
jgi:FkbM family methyltransferase